MGTPDHLERVRNGIDTFPTMGAEHGVKYQIVSAKLTRVGDRVHVSEARYELLRPLPPKQPIYNMPNPTHCCKECGALWKSWAPYEAGPGEENKDGSWSLVSSKCGQCCDNVEMGDQIERLFRKSSRGLTL